MATGDGIDEGDRRGGTGPAPASIETPAHPRRAAALLMIGVVVLLVVASILSVISQSG